MVLPNDPLLEQIAQATIAAQGGSREQHRQVYFPMEDPGDIEGRRIVLGILFIAVVVIAGLLFFK